MRWLNNLFRRTVELREDTEEQQEAMKSAEKQLEDLEHKITCDVQMGREINRAVASARRVQYRVHTFTQEISDSFGRLNHG